MPPPPSTPAAVSDERLATLLAPYLEGFPTPASLLPQLSMYLDLLLRWNARTNLTAIREPEAIVQRHFGESLYAGVQLARHLAPDLNPQPAPAATLLDLGSGAGFPGLPVQLLLPELRVTLAESQGKKASFLREAVRALALPHTEVWAGRAEALPAERRFDAVTLRAVDRMPEALAHARTRVAPGGWLLAFGAPGLAGSRSEPAPLHFGVTIERVP